ncbi:MAG TPA: hypothetical protein VNC50_16605 [Planctomycetia bacterium]|nr:hypothetical protein [Planctomycetia bacterium]
MARSLPLWAIAFLAPAAPAAEHYLTIGGGPKPDSSQVSIEQNVRFFDSLLVSVGVPAERRPVLFGSGNSKLPDVCFTPTSKPSELHRNLLRLFEQTGGAELDYRAHEVPNAVGGNTKSEILARLEELAKRVAPSDRVTIYVTGHGGRDTPTPSGNRGGFRRRAEGGGPENQPSDPPKNPPSNQPAQQPGATSRPAGGAHLYTWRGDRLTVKEFVRALDRFPPETEVAVVMVQCYCGGFANLIFEEGDPSRPLSKHRRAGFFATIETRPAAGCTPDTKIEDYREYSTYFWAAAGGRDRRGAPVAGVDVSGDGKIDFAEAHAHTLVHADTIDIPIKTSDRFLRKHAKLDPNDHRSPAAETYFSRLASAATPLERWTLETLSAELKLAGEDRIGSAGQRAKDVDVERRDVQRRIASLDRQTRERRDRIANSLLARWPFLAAAWHPKTHVAIEKDDPEMRAAIEKHADAAEWKKQREEIARLRAEDLRLERRWAKLERLRYVAESAALALRLALVGPEPTRREYEGLLKLENASLPSAATRSR